MNLESLWRELEEAITPEQQSGRRRLHAESPADLNVTLTQPGPRRGFSLTVRTDALTGDIKLPDSRGLEHVRRPGTDGRTTLELILSDPGAKELFTSLADDVASAAARATDDSGAAGAWLSRIRSWQKLMARNASGLSEEAQRGLYAELDVVREVAGRAGVEVAVEGWRGPLGGHDMQLAGGSYEVKGTASHQPQIVEISSERQLDETGTASLHLIHLSLDVHQHAGESLPDIVAACRGLARKTAAEHLLDERLVDAGYTDAHQARYELTGYTIRERNFFRVRPGFPRITEADLSDGVGGVRYRLVIASCKPFATSADDAYSALV